MTSVWMKYWSQVWEGWEVERARESMRDRKGRERERDRQSEREKQS